jgi:hypothetical protein
MAGRTPLQQGDQFLKSAMPADDGYAQNGYQGASSVTPGKTVSSNFLPELRAKTFENVQKRSVSAEQYPAAVGTRNRLVTDTYAKVPTGNARPVKK